MGTPIKRVFHQASHRLSPILCQLHKNFGYAYSLGQVWIIMGIILAFTATVVHSAQAVGVYRVAKQFAANKNVLPKKPNPTVTGKKKDNLIRAARGVKSMLLGKNARPASSLNSAKPSTKVLLAHTVKAEKISSTRPEVVIPWADDALVRSSVLLTGDLFDSWGGADKDHPVVVLDRLLSRYPRLAVVMKNTVTYARRKAEHCLVHAVLPAQAMALKAAFERLPPCSALGWKMYAAVLRNIAGDGAYHQWVTPAMVQALRQFWVQHVMNPDKQKQFLDQWRSFLRPHDHRARVLMCLERGEEGLVVARALCQHTNTGVPDLVLTLLTKNIVQQRPHLLNDVKKMLMKPSGDPVLALALARFCVRQSRADLALQAWQWGRLHQWFSGSTLWGRAPDGGLSASTGGGPDNLTLARDSQQTSCAPDDVFTPYFSKLCTELFYNVVRELMQEGQRLAVSGQAHQASHYFHQALKLLPEHPHIDHQPECLWLKGFLWIACLREPAKALAWFQALTVPREAPDHSFRWRLRGHYWAAVCHQALGRSDKARTQWALAAPYPFYFYGQLAAAALGQVVPLRFSAVDARMGMTSADQQALGCVLQGWRDHHAIDKNIGPSSARMGKGFIGGGAAYAFEQDCLQAARTPADKKRVLEWIHLLSPRHVTSCAKSFSVKPDAIFHQAFPRITLPKLARDPELVHGIILAETAFDPLAISSAGARGLMQVMPAQVTRLAADAGVRASVDALKDPVYAMTLGITEVHNTLRTYGDCYMPAIAAYNADSRKVNHWLAYVPREPTLLGSLIWLESIRFGETRAYVARVLENRAVYRAMQGHPLTLADWQRVLSLKPGKTGKKAG